MERICSICQSATLEDEDTICSVCGAELTPIDDAEEVQEEPLTPVRVDEEESQEEPADDTWDTGAVGGETGTDIEQEPEEEPEEEPQEEAEEIEVGEDELLCPNCKEIVKIGSESCSNCNAGTEYLVSCPACAMGIDKLADICPHCYTDLNLLKKEASDSPESAEPEEATAKPSEEAAETSDEPESVEAAELGQNGDLSEKEKKKMLKKLLKEQKDLEKQLKKGEITEEEFAERLDEIRTGNGFGPIGGYVLEEAEGKSLEEAEMGQNGGLSEKDKKKMLKKLEKEQKNLEKQLKKGEITEEEFAESLDKIRLGNGFGPIGGYVLDEAEDREIEAQMTEDDITNRRADRAARREMIKEELAKERSQGIFNYYNLSLVTLFFFIFLALFVLMEFIFTIGNFTTQADVPTAIFFDFT
ncbi:MAG: SHOCT domain-containing protein, partial [Thermoplasmata archaeon]|nr:SHOCT domain-containing protein [Thermoplasmata archaeon]